MSFSYNFDSQQYTFKKGFLTKKLGKRGSMLTPTSDQKETKELARKLKKLDRKQKSKSVASIQSAAPNFHKRTEKKDPTDREACQSCDYNCCCEMLRLAVKKLGGRKDNYVI